MEDRVTTPTDPIPRPTQHDLETPLDVLDWWGLLRRAYHAEARLAAERERAERAEGFVEEMRLIVHEYEDKYEDLRKSIEESPCGRAEAYQYEGGEVKASVFMDRWPEEWPDGIARVHLVPVLLPEEEGLLPNATESRGFCMKEWVAKNEKHYCYLNPNHSGECACGFCDMEAAGHDNLHATVSE